MITRPRQAIESRKPAVARKFIVFGNLLPMVLIALGGLFLSSCGGINVMGRKISDSEYKAGYDSAITRDKPEAALR